MSIQQIIAEADTTSNPHTVELTNGLNEAILIFRFRKTADEVARALKAEGATVEVQRTDYKQYLLIATWK